MPSMQSQVLVPVRRSRLRHTALASAAALAGFSPLSFADFIEDSSASRTPDQPCSTKRPFEGGRRASTQCH